MSFHHRGGRKYSEYPDHRQKLTDDYSWGAHGTASRKRNPGFFDAFDYELASDFTEGMDFAGIASANECTGLIPNGITDGFAGASYAELYENVHQPENDPEGGDPERM